MRPGTPLVFCAWLNVGIATTNVIHQDPWSAAMSLGIAALGRVLAALVDLRKGRQP